MKKQTIIHWVLLALTPISVLVGGIAGLLLVVFTLDWEPLAGLGKSTAFRVGHGGELVWGGIGALLGIGVGAFGGLWVWKHIGQFISQVSAGRT